MTADLSVVDADGHLCEPARLWEDNLPPRLREQGIRLRWNEQTGYDECLVEVLAWRLATLYDIVYLTGRPERCRTATADWLLRNELPRSSLLLMRRGCNLRVGDNLGHHAQRQRFLRGEHRRHQI